MVDGGGLDSLLDAGGVTVCEDSVVVPDELLLGADVPPELLVCEDVVTLGEDVVVPDPLFELDDDTFAHVCPALISKLPGCVFK